MYIARVIGSQSYALDDEQAGAELGMKKYAKKFKTKKEAYSYMWRYFRVNKNDTIIEEA